MAVEVSAAKRERDFYLAQVDASKAQTAMLERRREVRPACWARNEEAVEFRVYRRCNSSHGVARMRPCPSRYLQVRNKAQILTTRTPSSNSTLPTPGLMQRSDMEAAPRADSQGNLPAAEPQAADKPANPVLVRRYGQRKPKADPILDEGVPSLSGVLLKQLAGRKRQAHAHG